MAELSQRFVEILQCSELICLRWISGTGTVARYWLVAPLPPL